MRQAAAEYGPHLRVNGVRPGAIRTAAWKDIAQEVVDAVVKRTPLKRIGEPREVADAIEFLTSPRAGFITGSILTVDGGWLATKG